MAYVGQSVRVKFKVVSVDPVTEAEADVLALGPGAVVAVERPDGTTLTTKTPVHYGEGWWGEVFESDVAGRHLAYIDGTDAPGDFTVHDEFHFSVEEKQGG